jgi:hypothetical protein
MSESRKRRSLFDVPPEAMGFLIDTPAQVIDNGLPEAKSDDQAADLDGANRRKRSQFDIPPSQDGNVSSAFISDAISDFLVSLGVATGGENSAVDQAFRIRIKNAMTRNLEYVRKLDAGIVVPKQANAVTLTSKQVKAATQTPSVPKVNHGRSALRYDLVFAN